MICLFDVFSSCPILLDGSSRPDILQSKRVDGLKELVNFIQHGLYVRFKPFFVSVSIIDNVEGGRRFAFQRFEAVLQVTELGADAGHVSGA